MSIFVNLVGAPIRGVLAFHEWVKSWNTTRGAYVGTIGQRMDLELTLDQVHVLDSGSLMHRFHDAAGNVFTWFTVGDEELEAGRIYQIEAVIKEHKIYRDVRENHIHRVELPADAITPTPSRGMKTCPRCAEDVRAAAKVCRYCGHEFQSAQGAPR